jgi:hypothetical protein
MAAAPIGFSWVNYNLASIIEKDEDDLSIIKSHAMRLVHRERRKHPVQTDLKPKKRARGSKRQNSPRLGPPFNKANALTLNPETDWEQVAICHFLEDFVYPEQSAPVIAFQYFSFLPKLYNKYSTRSCLTEAISAVALARLANQVNGPDLSFRAREAYANALCMVNKSMSIPKMRKSDQVLTSLCLLTKYELISGDTNDDWFQFHEKGQVALIREKDSNWVQSEIGASLFRMVYLRHLLNCIRRSQRPGIELNHHIRELAFPTPCLRQLMALIYEIAIMRYDAAMSLHHKFQDSDDACCIVEAAIKIDADMTTLVNELPADMDYQTQANHLIPTKGVEGYMPNTINIFRDLQQASFWHVLFFARVHVLQTMLSFSRFQLKFAPAHLHSRLQSTVDYICSSVPYALNEKNCDKAFITTQEGRAVAAHYLVWMLATASSVAGVPNAQLEWISDRLTYIGYAHGIKTALVYA